MGIKLTFPCFLAQNGRAARWLNVRLSNFCIRRAVFTLNETLAPHPVMSRPSSINIDLIHFLHSLLQLDMPFMKAGAWKHSIKQICWKMWNWHRLQPSLPCDEWQRCLLTLQKIFPLIECALVSLVQKWDTCCRIVLIYNCSLRDFLVFHEKIL